MQKIRKKSTVVKKGRMKSEMNGHSFEMFGKKKTMGEMRFARAKTGGHSRRASQKFERIRKPVNLSEANIDFNPFVAF